MINYSLVQRVANSNTVQINQAKARIQAAIAANQQPSPEDEALVATAVYKTYAQAQYNKVMTLPQFAKYIANRGSLYSRSDVVGIIMMAVDCLREVLLNGEKVQLGELGNFYVALKSQGADSALDFNTANNIKAVKVKWEPTSCFDDLRQDAEFNFVARRDEHAKFLRSQKTGERYVANGNEDDYEEDERRTSNS